MDPKDLEKLLSFECPNCGSTHEPLMHEFVGNSALCSCFLCGYNGDITEFQERDDAKELAFFTKYFQTERLN